MHFNVETNLVTDRSLSCQNKPLVRNKTVGKVRLYLKQNNTIQPKSLVSYAGGFAHHLRCRIRYNALIKNISLRLGAKNMPEAFIRISLVFISSVISLKSLLLWYETEAYCHGITELHQLPSN